MSTALFPAGLTRTAWDDLQYRCKGYDDAATLGIRTTDLPTDPAKGWVIRTADLIAIGAMRHIADPESYTGVAVRGWTIWGRKKYANHIPAHVEQQKAFILWASQQGIAVEARALGLEVGFPEGSVVFESLAFRDPDGKSAPVDATGLQGWTLYTGEVIGTKEWTEPEADAVKTRDDGQPVVDELGGAGLGDPNTGYEPTGPSKIELAPQPVMWVPGGKDGLLISMPPAPQPPAVKVGDRVLGRWIGLDSDKPEAVLYVREITPGGRVLASSWPDSGEVSWAVVCVIEVLPPRATED